MDLEEKLGFRSAFFFVPLGRYTVPLDLLNEITSRGFEIGVHGLYHDWWTFTYRFVFEKRAPHISQYMKNWGAVGFRAPSTIHNREWLHELGIEYDASSFDTDPFEPLPHGARTIFPFEVIGKDKSKRYIELPYTLSQDYALFILTQHRGIEIWTRKLAWIAKHGGMALLDAHPDYMNSDNRLSFNEYPRLNYESFLHHVKNNYSGDYWHALPKEVAGFYRKSLQSPPRVTAGKEPYCEHRRNSSKAYALRPALAGKRALMIVFSHYPDDPRVRRAAEALLEAGMEVDVICLQKNACPASEAGKGVHVYRLPLYRKRLQKGRYLLEYGLFGFLAFMKATVLHLRRRYAFVHVHNMPDVLVFSALVPRLFGAKIILDLHDPMPEVFQAKYNALPSNPLIRLILRLERLSIAFAHLGLTTNIAFRNLFISRSCLPEKMLIIMNSPLEYIFNTRSAAPNKDSTISRKQFVLMYHGTIVERHGLDLAAKAISNLRSEIPGLHLHVFGSGDAFLSTFLQFIKEGRLDEIIHYHGPKTLEEIKQQISNIDLGLIPNRRNAFTEINFPTRVFEYLAMDKPVIAPRTTGIMDYFKEDELLYFNPDNLESLIKAIRSVYEDPDRARRVKDRGIAVYNRHKWSTEKDRYLNAIEKLLL